jgi:hypothetical protein
MKHGSFAGVMGLALVIGLTALQSVALEAGADGTGVRLAPPQGSGSRNEAVPSGELALGTVTLGRNVMADGKPLQAGTYRLRLTGENATPVPPGQTAQYERWVEFLRGGKVVAREVVSIVPGEEISQVAQDAPPRSGGSKVQLLKGNDYVRIWVNRGGNHYLIHLPTSAT